MAQQRHLLDLAFRATTFFFSLEISRSASLREPGNTARSLSDGRAWMPTKRGKVLSMTALEFLYSSFYPEISAGSFGSVVESVSNTNLKQSVPNFFLFLFRLTKACVQRWTPVEFPWHTLESVALPNNLTALVKVFRMKPT